MLCWYVLCLLSPIPRLFSLSFSHIIHSALNIHIMYFTIFISFFSVSMMVNRWACIVVDSSVLLSFLPLPLCFSPAHHSKQEKCVKQWNNIVPFLSSLHAKQLLLYRCFDYWFLFELKYSITFFSPLIFFFHFLNFDYLCPRLNVNSSNFNETFVKLVFTKSPVDN
jgi:hypothetical protein